MSTKTPSPTDPKPAANPEPAPSFYDQFRLPGGRGFDWQAMEDAGVDVS